MVDYSGVAVNTFDMTKGLFDAYNKYRTDALARDEKAAQMERAAYKTASSRQLEQDARNGNVNQAGLFAALLGSEQAQQALDVAKMKPENWNFINSAQQGMVQNGAYGNSVNRPAGGSPQGQPPYGSPTIPVGIQGQQPTGGLSPNVLQSFRLLNADLRNRRNPMQTNQPYFHRGGSY